MYCVTQAVHYLLVHSYLVFHASDIFIISSITFVVRCVALLIAETQSRLDFVEDKSETTIKTKGRSFPAMYSLHYAASATTVTSLHLFILLYYIYFMPN